MAVGGLAGWHSLGGDHKPQGCCCCISAGDKTEKTLASLCAVPPVRIRPVLPFHPRRIWEDLETPGKVGIAVYRGSFFNFLKRFPYFYFMYIGILPAWMSV